MPNSITNAIGTQRQFAKQPENVYQKRLIEPHFSRGLSFSTDNNAQLLATSLGLLGNSLTKESIAADKRARVLGEVEAERIFAVTSEQDKEKLSTLDILGQSKKFDIADNPYAVARLEELRGQHLNTLFRNEYDKEVFPNQPLADNSQANIKTYENFMSQKLQDSGIKIYNQTAFNKGFYGSRPVDVLTQDVKYRKQRQEDFEATRNASLGSKIDSVLAQSVTMSGDELADKLQDIQMDEMLTGVDTASRIKLLGIIGKGISSNGNPEQLTAWGETIAYFNTKDGEPVRVKDVVPMGEYTQMSNSANVHLNEKKTRDFLKSLNDVPSKLLIDKFEELKTKDPLFWKNVAPMYDNIYKQRIREEQEEIKREAARQAGVFRQQTIFSVLDDRFEAFNQNKALDSFGSLSNSKKVNVGNKEVTITDDELVAWGQGRLTAWGQEVRSGSLSPVDAAKKSMQLLSFPPMSALAKAMKQNNDNILRGLNPSSLIRDENGALQLPQGLEQMLNMYKIDKASFEGTFGDEQTTDVATLSDFIDMNGLQEGTNKFSIYKENRRNPDFRAYVEKETKSYVGEIDGTLDIRTLGGNGNNEDVTLYTNPILQNNLRKNFEAGLYSMQTSSDALNMAKRRVADNYVSFRGCAFPKNFIFNVGSNNQEQHVAAFLEDEYQKEAKLYGEGSLRFLYVGNSLQLWRGTNSIKTWDNVSIAEDIDKWYNLLPEDKKVKVNDVYFIPHYDTSSYYASNPDTSLIEQAEAQTGINTTQPVTALINAIGEMFSK